MLEILALLLPVAAASGWYAAARHYKSKPSPENPAHFTHAYFRGLNHLLNERPDKAMDVFVDMLEADGDTFETHLALGNLFRRRGEVEKAIGFHQNLVKKTFLNQEQHAQALYELAMDYMRAGLFDRAESLLIELEETHTHQKVALQQLLQIYQQEKDWLKAIEYTQKLKKLIQRGENAAQFFCELAEEAKATGNLGQAADFLEKAFAEDENCVRASLLKAQMEMDRKDYASALGTLKTIEQQDASYLHEILKPIQQCYNHLPDQEDLLDYLQYLYQKYHLAELAIHICNLLREKKGIDKAIEFMSKALAAHPTILGLDNMIDLQLKIATNEAKPLLRQLKEVTVRLLGDGICYRCEQCGFTGAELHWRCPSCHYWGAIKPDV